MFLLVIISVTQLFVLVMSHPYEDLNIVQLIQLHKYPVELHHVETPDGYLLTLHRIPHGLSNNVSKEAVILVHGMGGGSENFLFLGPPNALAFYLSDRGYDVWLSSARGTRHSRKHKWLHPVSDKKKFWNFSWHEIGVYDLSTSINYITKITGKDKIYYVGHSQGTTAFFAMLSEVPEINNKIKVAGLLAPSANLESTPSPLILFGAKLAPLLQTILEFINWHEMMIQNSPMVNQYLKALCKLEALTDLCIDLASIAGGTESGYLDKELLPALCQFSPSGFAAKQVYHYAQLINSGEFKLYDYGKRKNLRLYNSTKPPLYNLKNIRAPVGLFWSLQDPFANKKIIDQLSERLPNVALKYEVKADAFSHIDYILANNVKQEVYDPLYELFKKYEST